MKNEYEDTFKIYKESKSSFEEYIKEISPKELPKDAKIALTVSKSDLEGFEQKVSFGVSTSSDMSWSKTAVDVHTINQEAKKFEFNVTSSNDNINTVHLGLMQSIKANPEIFNEKLQDLNKKVVNHLESQRPENKLSQADLDNIQAKFRAKRKL